MPSNPFYTHTDSVPVQASRGSSSVMRNEFDLVDDGFDKVYNCYNDIGIQNALQITPLAAVTGITDFQKFTVRVLYATTGATTITIGSYGTYQIRYPDGTNLIANSILAGQIIELTANLTTGYFQYNANANIAAGSGLPLTGGTMSGPINEFHGANIASASSITLTSATGNFIHITGNTTINTIVIADGYERTCILDGAPLLVHSSTLLLPGAQNIQGAAGDRFVVRGDSGSVANIISYTKATGFPVIASPGATLYLANNFGGF